MFFWGRKPKRLYVPVKAKWYTRPRLKVSRPRNAVVLKKRGWVGLLREVAKKSLYVVVVIGACLALVAGLSLSSYFSIKSIEVDRENFSIDSAKIENKLSIFLGKNTLLFSKDRMKRLIQSEFPEFSDISIQKIFPATIKISLVAHPVVANIKAYYTLPPAEEQAPQNFTELGKAIEELSATDPSLLGQISPFEDKGSVKGIFSLEDAEKQAEDGATEQKGLINRIGQSILDQGEENLELMTWVVKGLTQPMQDREFVIPTSDMDYLLGAIQYFTNTMGLEIQSLEYYTAASELRLKIKGNVWIWMSTDRDYKEQIDKLKKIYEPAELSKEDLSYIDLRIKEKIIYCPRHSRCDKSE